MKNKYEIRGDVTAIYLKRKGKNYETIIDTSDLDKVNSFPNTWFLGQGSNGNIGYVSGFLTIGYKKKKSIILQRFLANAPDNMIVDHFNHDTLDNRQSSNLRIVTKGQNNQNLLESGRKNGKIRGVRFSEQHNKWFASVRVNRKTVYGGIFESCEEAEIAVKEARAVHMPYSIEAKTITVSDPSKYIKNKVEPYKSNKSGVRHVWYHSKGINKKWRAEIAGKYIGSFITLEDATEAVRTYKINNGMEYKIS